MKTCTLALCVLESGELLKLKPVLRRHWVSGVVFQPCSVLSELIKNWRSQCCLNYFTRRTAGGSRAYGHVGTCECSEARCKCRAVL